MVQKYQMHHERHRDRCFKGYAGKICIKCKYDFPFKTPQLNKELDEDGICLLFIRDARKTNLLYHII